jgi:hypothetical protein
MDKHNINAVHILVTPVEDGRRDLDNVLENGAI